MQDINRLNATVRAFTKLKPHEREWLLERLKDDHDKMKEEGE